MLLPIKPVLGKRTRIDSTRPVYLQYCFSSTRRILLNTEIYVPPKYWNKRQCRFSSELPCEFGDPAALNTELARQKRVVEDIVSFALKEKMPDPLAFLKNTFSIQFDCSKLQDIVNGRDEEQKKKVDFFFQFEDYINSKKRKVSPGMIKVFYNTMKVLKRFQQFRKKPIRFEEIDYNFYEEIVDYLLFDHVQLRKKEEVKGLRISSTGRIIKQLRVFLRNRMRKKIIAPIDLDDFKILDEESDAIYLNEEEIRAIYQADLSEHPHLDKYRYLFVFGCLTGLRFSDFSCIQSDDVRGKRLYKKQGKSDHWVVIPLREDAYTIFVDIFNRQIPPITNPDFNWYIKEVGHYAGITEQITFSHKKGNQDIVEAKPKCKWITSHTCRRSFCTNEFLAGTPAELIMKISGHKSLRDFYKYIRITPEQAANQVEKIWSQRETLATV